MVGNVPNMVITPFIALHHDGDQSWTEPFGGVDEAKSALDARHTPSCRQEIGDERSSERWVRTGDSEWIHFA
jgi:hypothetical protein